MKLEDIITLLNAGYTKEEIQALDQPASNDQHPEVLHLSSSGDSDNSFVASTKSDAEKPEAVVAAPAAPASDERDDKVLGAINALTAAIQKMNVQSSNIPGGDLETTPEDVLANIINPPKLNK